MKYIAKIWLLAMGVAFVTLAAIPPAEARSTTGWNAFRVWSSPPGLTSASRKASARRSTDATSISTLRSSWWLIPQDGNTSQFGMRLAGMEHSRARPRTSRALTTTLVSRMGKLSILKDKNN